jgi:hypothetical protein
MPSSGMLHLVGLVITDVREELSASIIRVARIGELGLTLYFFVFVLFRMVLLLLVATNVQICQSRDRISSISHIRNLYEKV